MIYKFKVWVWLPMTTEVYLDANKDEEAVSIFNKIDLKKGFNWKDDGIRNSRATYEIVETQDDNQSSRDNLPSKQIT